MHDAWSLDPRCVECGERIASALHAALLVSTGRVAHRERCFVSALVRGHPFLYQLAARRRAQEVTHEKPENDGDAWP